MILFLLAPLALADPSTPEETDTHTAASEHTFVEGAAEQDKTSNQNQVDFVDWAELFANDNLEDEFAIGKGFTTTVATPDTFPAQPFASVMLFKV